MLCPSNVYTVNLASSLNHLDRFHRLPWPAYGVVCASVEQQRLLPGHLGIVYVRSQREWLEAGSQEPLPQQQQQQHTPCDSRVE